jgi:large subunit ribosomal protein L4
MEYPLYNQNAENMGKVDLPDNVFGLDMNPDLIHQVIVSQMANKRQVIAHVKDRSEVRGGGIKPHRQKGTGRARAGSIRSPIWIGGGVTFGPTKKRVFKRKLNKKMARKALFMTLSSKIDDKELVVVDDIKFDNWKTKEMALFIKNASKLFGDKGSGRLLVITPGNERDTIKRVINNIPKTDVLEARNLNALSIVARKNILILKDAIKVIEKTFT